MRETKVTDAMNFCETALNALRFVNDLIIYIAESVDDDEDDLSVEFICRKLRKNNLIDVNGDRYVLTYEIEEPE